MAELHRVLTIAAAAATILVAGCQRSAEAPAAPKAAAYNSVDITGAAYANALGLPDVDGRVRTLSDFKGKVTVVFFGYTQCPDVCPATLAELAQVKKALGADGARVQGIFVTVDPERDTPQLLKTYVQSFGPDFVALRGTPEQTRDAAKNFKVFYSKVPGRADGSYSIDHTAGSYIFDAQGRVRLFSRYGGGADKLAADLKQLLAEGA